MRFTEVIYLDNIIQTTTVFPDGMRLGLKKIIYKRPVVSITSQVEQMFDVYANASLKFCF